MTNLENLKKGDIITFNDTIHIAGYDVIEGRLKYNQKKSGSITPMYPFICEVIQFSKTGKHVFIKNKETNQIYNISLKQVESKGE